MSSFFSFFYQNVAWQESATVREDDALLCSRKTLQNRVQSCLSRALSQELVMPAGAGRRSLQAGGSEEMVPGTKRRGGVGVAIYRSRRQTIIRICLFWLSEQFGDHMLMLRLIVSVGLKHSSRLFVTRFL